MPGIRSPRCPKCGGKMRYTRIEWKWLCKDCNEIFGNDEVIRE